MVDSQHVLTVVWKQTGLDVVTSGVQNLEKTSQTTAKAQDTLAKSMDDTTKSAAKTGKELDTTTKSADKTGKSTKTLGQSFKDSSLLIAGFASSMVSLYMQYDRIADQSMKIDRMRAQLDATTKKYDLTEASLNQRLRDNNITQVEYAAQMSKLASQREALAVREQQYTDMIGDQQAAWLQFAVSVIPAVSTGYTSVTNILDSLRGTQEATTASTEGLNSVTEVLGVTANTATTTGLVPTVKAMQEMLVGSKNTGDTIKTVVNPAVTDLQSGLYETEKSGNIFIKAFKGMGTSIKNFAASIKIDMASATGIVDKLRTGFVSFFTHLGSGFKALGTHIADSIKSLFSLRAASITAILTNPAFLIITAIAGSVLALATNFGGVRDAVNGFGVALGNAIPPLKGVLTWIGEMGNAALDNIASFLGFDTAVAKSGETAIAVAKKYGTAMAALGEMFKIINYADFGILEGHLNTIRVDLGKLSKEGVTALARLDANFLNFYNSIAKKTPEVDALFKELKQVWIDAQAAGTDYNVVAEKMTEIINKIMVALFGEAKGIEKTIAAQAGLSTEMDKSNKSTEKAQSIISSYFNNLAAGEQTYKQFALAVVTGNDDMIKSMGLSEEEIQKLLERFTKDYPEGAVAVVQSGEQIVKSVALIKEQFAGTSKDITTFVDDVKKAISPGLVDTFAEAQKAVSDYNVEQEYLKEVSHLVTLGVTKDSELWAAYIDLLVKKYPQLGKTATEVKDDIVKAQQDQEKEREKENKTVDKQIEKAKALAETRREEIVADQALATEATKLIATMGQQITVTDMTGKGLQSLIQIYDDTANATNIAADAIGLWYAELLKNQAVDTATIEKLDQLATSIGITIPEEIRSQGIPAIKAYIEQITGMGEGAKKVKEEILKTFEDLKNQSQGLLDGIISDKLGEDGDEIKKVLKGIQKAGYELNSFVAEPRVISIFMDDQKFDNDLQGFSEILAGEMDRMGNISAEGGDRAITTMIEQMRSTLGEKGSTIMEDVDLIWETIQNSKVPGETGNITTAKFAEAMKNPTVVAEAIRTNNTAILAELGLLPPKVATEAEKVPTSAAAAIKNQSGTPAEEMRNMAGLMVGQLNLILSDEVNTTLPGYVGMFGEKFTEMGNTAANLATAAETHFKTINDAMLLMQTNVSSLYKVWDAVMKDADQSQKDFVTSSTKSFETTDNSIRLTETNISSLYKVWEEALKEMENKVNTFANACETAFGKTKESADTARSAVEALQTAIDNLKDKEVKITYRIETVGSPPEGARFGGSTIGYAQRGAAWIQSKPRNIGGMNTAEFSKPELITATPLSNPYNVMDKSISLPSLASASSRGGGSPIVVTGDINTTVVLPDGKVLANEVKKYLLTGFSGIT